MSTQRQSGSMGDELTNILMVGLAALFGLILAIRGAARIKHLLFEIEGDELRNRSVIIHDQNFLFLRHPAFLLVLLPLLSSPAFLYRFSRS